MNYRTLGKTNLKVAELGIGTWQLVDDPEMWVGGDLTEAMKTLYKYTELGGNFIDTAWMYGYESDHQGFPTSESFIGKFLKESGKRDSLVIASKVAPKNWKWPARKNVPYAEVFPKEHIEKLVHESLARLGVDFVDVMQFHVWQDDWADIDEWKEVATRLTKEGKVKNWGISLNDYQPSNCFKTIDTGLISTVQCIFNLFHQRPTTTLFPYAKERNIGIIARVPLDEGGLTGKMTMDRVLIEGDFRNKYFGPERRAELVKHIAELDALRLQYPEISSVLEMAIRYILSFSEISTMIPGMRKPSYVEENIALSEKGPLSTKLLENLKSYAWERNFYGSVDPALEAQGYIEK